MPKRREQKWLEEPEAMEIPSCWLCERPLGKRVEWHHPVPKSRKGRETVAVHPIGHRTLHANFDNRELAAISFDRDRLVAEPRLASFMAWIADKPADFHAETRQSAAKPARWKK